MSDLWNVSGVLMISISLPNPLTTENFENAWDAALHDTVLSLPLINIYIRDFKKADRATAEVLNETGCLNCEITRDYIEIMSEYQEFGRSLIDYKGIQCRS